MLALECLFSAFLVAGCCRGSADPAENAAGKFGTAAKNPPTVVKS
jgi:hypothetical protein